MRLNLLAFAVPLFLVFIGAEYLYARRKRKTIFHFGESIANLNVGMAERLTDLFTTGAFYFLYTWLYQHFAIFSIPSSVPAWLVLFLFTDFIWYWYHRFAHEINLFWAAHIVHHQSEDFNYTTSTRITMFQAGIRGTFWAILPVLGFPPEMIAVFLLVHGAYPFFTHTQTIGKLGWLESVLVTPSHHRVHHASNEAYLDKNYGDILIIWDKIFGTFAAEKETPTYGITTPLKSHSFFWQHFHHFLELGVAIHRTRGLANKRRVLWGKPETVDGRIRLYLERRLLHRQTGTLSKELKQYVAFQTSVTMVLLFTVLLLESYLAKSQLILAALFLLVSIINTGALLEKQRWILYPEAIRLALLALFIGNYTSNAYFLILCGAAFLFLLSFRKTIGARYRQLLYASN
jgi:alkylglycerol monooxygenase